MQDEDREVLWRTWWSPASRYQEWWSIRTKDTRSSGNALRVGLILKFPYCGRLMVRDEASSR